MANEHIRVANIENVLKTALDLFIKQGIQNTTREMIARSSGLSRRSTERYFPSMKDCVVKSAEFCGKKLVQRSQVFEMLDSNKYTAADLLTAYFKELQLLLLHEPRMYILYSEYKSYLYRNSEDCKSDYMKMAEAIGFRWALSRIFERGKQDGTVRAHYSPEANASYLLNTVLGFFSTVALLYSKDPVTMKSYTDKYIKDTWNLYCVQNLPLNG